MARKPDQQQAEIDPNVDRYPNFVQGMRRILQEADIDDRPIERLEVTFLASGEATYRVWEPRSDDYEGGYLGPS